MSRLCVVTIVQHDHYVKAVLVTVVQHDHYVKEVFSYCSTV